MVLSETYVSKLYAYLRALATARHAGDHHHLAPLQRLQDPDSGPPSGEVPPELLHLVVHGPRAVPPDDLDVLLQHPGLDQKEDIA